MKVAFAPTPLLAVVAVVGGTAAAVGLSVLSRPAEADPRMAQVRDTVAQVRRLDSQPGTPGALPLGAVCASDTATAAVTYKAAVAAAAERHKLTTGGLSVAVTSPAVGDLAPVTIHWKGVGEYSAFVSVLADLAAEKPALFVEALDIKPRASRAEFELKGRIWCWTPAVNRH